jgi:hypothetical protein
MTAKEMVAALWQNACTWNLQEFARRANLRPNEASTQEAFLALQEVAERLGRFSSDTIQVIFSPSQGAAARRENQTAANNHLLRWIRHNVGGVLYQRACLILSGLDPGEKDILSYLEKASVKPPDELMAPYRKNEPKAEDVKHVHLLGGDGVACGEKVSEEDLDMVTAMIDKVTCPKCIAAFTTNA